MLDITGVILAELETADRELEDLRRAGRELRWTQIGHTNWTYELDIRILNTIKREES